MLHRPSFISRSHTPSIPGLSDGMEVPPTHDTARDAFLPGASRPKWRKVTATPPGLKPPTRGLSEWRGRSDTLSLSVVPARAPVRPAYLMRFVDSHAPVISASPFVPPAIVVHLMRNKKDSAIGVKFLPGSNDAITLMEGAMHTFVTPVACVLMHGDYVWAPGHAVVDFGSYEGKQIARHVVLSASVHPDFETPYVLQRLAALAEQPFYGSTLDVKHFQPLSVRDKQDDRRRTAYDAKLKQHMVAHLVHDARLPARDTVLDKALLERRAVALVENAIHGETSPRALMRDTFLRVGNEQVISLELLLNTYVHTARNELSALEQTCPQGYVYTFDPPAIFAQTVGATLLNRLQIAAWRTLSEDTEFRNMRVLGFNDYDDKDALPLVEFALKRQTHVRVMPKAQLFRGPRRTYAPPASAQGALLVLHNNSDAFGQNIETESSGYSMDGAIGCNSSAAAALHREHPDLLNQVI